MNITPYPKNPDYRPWHSISEALLDESEAHFKTFKLL